MPSSLNGIPLKITAAISQQASSSYQIVWSLAKADGSANYGSETVTQSTAPTLNFSFQVQSFGGPNTAYFGTFTAQQATVPEPSATVILFTAVGGLLAYAWRKRK